jgi:hypothetical protein
MNQIHSKVINNLLRHLIFRNVSLLATVMETKVKLGEKQLPSWVEKPVQEMLDDFFLDLAHSMQPTLEITRDEYKDRPDRLKLLDYIDKRVKDSAAKVDLKCHCAGCKDTEKFFETYEPRKVTRKTKPFKTLMDKRLTKDEIKEIETEAKGLAKKLKDKQKLDKTDK